MNKFVKTQVFFFFIVIFCIASLAYFFDDKIFSTPFDKPWHLSPSIHEDSLSQDYLKEFDILNKDALQSHLYDSTRTNVYILVDAWGVPNQNTTLDKDYAIFEDVPHIFALHQRLANRTKHAERVEFRNPTLGNIYLFGGDSLEYNRQDYIKELGFEKSLYCNKCSDSLMIEKIDSILAVDSLKFIAWTTQSSRSGDRDSLHKSLKFISKFAKHHPNIQIVVQGTHRPILAKSKIRNSYKSHWVPVVILNGNTL